MLTINFDPRHPQEALETCASIAELLGDYIGQRRPDFDIPERAASVVSDLCDALASVQERAATAFLSLIAEAEARARPAAAPAPTRAEIVEQGAAECGMPVVEYEKMLARGIAIARGRAAIRGGDGGYRSAIADAERELIFKTILECKGDQPTVLKTLKMSQRSLQYKLKSYRAAGVVVPRLVKRSRGGDRRSAAAQSQQAAA